MIRIVALISFVLIAFGSLNAQIDQATFDSLKAKYPNSDGVFLNYDNYVTLSIDKKKGLQIETRIVEKRLFFDEGSKYYSDDKIRFSNHLHIKDVNAYTLIPIEGKSKMRMEKVTEFDTTNNYSSDIFYDDYKNLEILFRGLQKGAMSVLEYTEIEVEPHFFGSCYMASYMPILKGVLQVEMPKDLELNYQTRNFEGYNIKFTKTEGKKSDILRWEFTEVPKMRYVSGAVGVAYLFPVIMMQIKEYQFNGETVKVIPDLDHMYKWYYSNIENSKLAPDDTLADIVKKITENDSTELDKVKSVFSWVQDNIEYVALEYGKGGIVPREAGLVYSRRYGDCKDMSCLTHKMLKSIGIESAMTWIGTRDIPFKYSEIPSPLIDNHMICSYEYEDSTYFLDATNPTVPFGVPTAFIQSKEALIEKGPDGYSIEKVPSMPATFSGKKDSCVLRIENDELVGECQCEFKGYTASGIRANLKVKKGGDVRDYMEFLLKKGSNKYKLVDYNILTQNDKNEPLIVNYSFRIKSYMQTVGDESYLNLNLQKFLKGGKFDEKTFVYDYEADYAFQEEEINILKLPEGTQVQYMPENSSLEKDDYSYSITYGKGEQEVKLHTKVVIDYLIFPTSRFEEWNKAVSKINRDFNESLLLKSKTQ